MWVFCGLGNHGRKYERTRHNLGFIVLSAFAEKKGLKFRIEEAYPAEVARFEDKCLLFKPQTYMNLSGIAVKKLMRREAIKPEQLIVIHDDLDLALGRIKIIPKGGAGGHNGVKSIIDELGTNSFPRLKLGIGRPKDEIDQKDYVLSTFDPEELPLVQRAIETAVQALEDLLKEDLLKVMTKYNSLKHLA